MDEIRRFSLDGKRGSIRQFACVECGNETLVVLQPLGFPEKRLPYCGECEKFIYSINRLKRKPGRLPKTQGEEWMLGLSPR